ncbi:hypothetical protein A2U01_0066827, partial [Trifolium medium]|nr:hypothetical protein [Trifolium medium]
LPRGVGWTTELDKIRPGKRGSGKGLAKPYFAFGKGGNLGQKKANSLR